MINEQRALAVVTGASSGIGFELAKIAARKSYDLVIAANDAKIANAADQLQALGVRVTALQVDLSNNQGTDQLIEKIGDRPVDILMANAATGLGGTFLDQGFADVHHIIDTNITGTLRIIHHVGNGMRARNHGRILITGSIAGFMPGPYNAVYNASKAFIDSFSWALRNELKDSGVSVTCLMPGATETEFFERAGLSDTKIGRSKKDDPADVAQIGFDAMMDGDGDVVAGWYNKLQAAIANITPASVLANSHRKMAEPQASGSAGDGA